VVCIEDIRETTRQVIKRVLDNIGMVIEIAYERDWKRTLELAGELEKRTGIPVYLDEVPRDEYPALG